MTKISVHDNRIISYTVDSKNREITILTEYRERGEPYEYTDVKFTSVLGYYFDDTNLDTVIFDIQQSDIDDILDDYKELFEQGINYCWPGSWNTSLQDAKTHISNVNANIWRLNSSYGMSGFIIANDMNMIRKEAVEK